MVIGYRIDFESLPRQRAPSKKMNFPLVEMETTKGEIVVSEWLCHLMMMMMMMIVQDIFLLYSYGRNLTDFIEWSWTCHFWIAILPTLTWKWIHSSQSCTRWHLDATWQCRKRCLVLTKIHYDYQNFFMFEWDGTLSKFYVFPEWSLAARGNSRGAETSTLWAETKRVFVCCKYRWFLFARRVTGRFLKERHRDVQSTQQIKVCCSPWQFRITAREKSWILKVFISTRKKWPWLFPRRRLTYTSTVSAANENKVSFYTSSGRGHQNPGFSYSSRYDGSLILPAVWNW